MLQNVVRFIRIAYYIYGKAKLLNEWQKLIALIINIPIVYSHRAISYAGYLLRTGMLRLHSPELMNKDKWLLQKPCGERPAGTAAEQRTK